MTAGRADLVNKGVDLYSRGLYLDAAKVLNEAMDLYAQHDRRSAEYATVVMNLASAYAELGELTLALEGNVYNHNFFVIDHQPPGPDFAIKFPFQISGTRAITNLAAVHGNQIDYLKILGNGDTAATPIQGIGETAKDNDIFVENRKTGAGVYVTGDKPLARVYLWSVKTTLCPEVYVNLQIQPGQESKWKARGPGFRGNKLLLAKPFLQKVTLGKWIQQGRKTHPASELRTNARRQSGLVEFSHERSRLALTQACALAEIVATL